MAQATGIEHDNAPSRPVMVDVLGTLALTLYSVTTAASFAALVFTGPAAGGLPRGASTFLFVSGFISVFLGLRTRFPLAFGLVQDTAAIVLVPAVAVIAANGSQDPVRDVFVVLSASSLLTGAAMWLIGRARLAGAARFMPTTVVAGFLAGTGWLLAKGGVDVMTGRTIRLGDIDVLFDGEVATLWLPGVALGLLVAIVPLIARLSPLVSSVATVAATVAFFIVVATASTLGAVERGGWLLGPFPDGGSIEFIGGDIVDADWSAIGSAGGQLGVVVILSVLGVLLNISGIQVLLRQRIDLDAELRTAGIANILVASVGGLVAYHGLGDSALAERLGVSRRWAPIAVGLSTILFALVGVKLVGFLPRFVAGGLLIGAGLGLLISWVRELRTTPSWSDRAVSVLILATICFIGILEGIVVGIVAACVFFVVRYSRIDAVRVVSTGKERRSVVERSAAEVAQLDEHADRIAVYELHGSLFFGSVSGIAATIRDRLSRSASPVDIVIVDFARVADIDSSAFAVLAEIAEDADAVDVGLIWCGLEPAAVVALSRAEGAVHASVVEDLDAAVEQAEDRLLSTSTELPADDRTPEPYSDALLGWFTPRFHGAGEVIMSEGDGSDELVAVLTGSVHVSRTDRTGRELRLRTLRAGAIVGEIGFLTGEPRTATVTAETDVELRVLTTDAHTRLRRDRPDLVIELYDRVLRSTADRAAAIHRSLTQALR